EEGLKRVLEEDDNLFDKHVVDEENDEYNEEPGEVDSEDYNTDDLVSLDEESDEGEGVKNRNRRRKAPRFKQFRRESDLLKPTFHLGMEFTNMEQCRELWDYCEELKSNNPGSTVIVKTELQGENPIFKRIYVCFGALKKGFVEGCRQVVGFDGCHVKGSHLGQIL
ncbi:PREDICTED: LOC107462923 isoform, partial [Prunus dulcis]